MKKRIKKKYCFENFISINIILYIRKIYIKLMYKIIVPYDTQGFLQDAKVLQLGFPDSEIHMAALEMPFTPVNIFIDRVKYIENLNTAVINILSANQEVTLTSKHYKWQIPFMRRIDYVLTKTNYGTKIMTQLRKKYKLEFEIYYIGHTTLFPIKSIHRRDYQHILHLAGAHEFKNTDTIIKCWLAQPDLPPVIIGCYDNCLKNSLDKYLTAEEYQMALHHPNIQIITKKLSFDDIVIMKYYHAIQLCPSITEGYGHYINEARITKSLVITTNLPPMNEFIDDTSGILINCDRIESKDNGNELCLISIDELANVVRRVMQMTPDEIDKMGLNAFHRYQHDTDFYLQESHKIDKIILNQAKFLGW